MKTLLTSLFLTGVILAGAQSKVPCEEHFTAFEQHYTSKFNEKSILTPVGRQETLFVINNILEKCPSYSSKIYLYGEDMLKSIIQPINVGQEKTEWVNHLNNLYDKQSTFFPETRQENELKKVLFSYNNRAISEVEAFETLDALYKTDKKIFTAEALNIYANVLIKRASSRKDPPIENINKIDAINTAIQAKIDELEQQKLKFEQGQISHREMPRNIEHDISSLKITSRNIAASLKGANLDCNIWNNIYREEFEKNRSDIFWLENTLDKLKNYNCNRNNEFFERVARHYYELRKTSKSAFYMGELAHSKREMEKAMAYFNESAQLETDSNQKADLYYRIASFYKNTDSEQAKNFALKAIDNNPEMIEAYIMLSKLYAEADDTCFSNEFEKKAKYLLAAQTIDKIIAVNPKYESTAKKLSDSFKEKAPTKAEIKKAKMRGKTLKFGCWINQSIVIPK